MNWRNKHINFNINKSRNQVESERLKGAVALPPGTPVTRRLMRGKFSDLANELSKRKRTRTNVFGSFEVDGDNFKKAEIRSSWVRFRNDYVYNPKHYGT